MNFNGSEIAVIGMAARVPGARNLAEYWRNLRDGVESVTKFTDEQLRAAGESPDLMRDPQYVRAGGMLADIDKFDAEFFGFSPQDAAIMDPQHRILLEVAWEAMEHAAYDPERFRGSVGVFATCGMNSYMMHHLVRNRRIMDTVGEWLVRHTGNDMNFLATRLSYEMNLKGPSMNVQTACSSALVAIHLASQSLLTGECDMALAGGCAINYPNDRGYVYKTGEILSPDGHCRAFDARSAGTIFGSGAGMVVLRRLADAIEDGDPIAAILLGSAVNNDGSGKVGYLAPSVEGQSKAVSEALGAAGVSPESISLIETHGTGTNVGDPIEVTALTEAYRRHTQRKNFCAIGSVKTNMGHLGEAAGAAGFIKTVLALQNRQMPPSLHYEAPNPQIDFANSPFFVNAKLRDWTANGEPRRAGVTALGAGGTNCHVVLQEAPDRTASGTSRPAQLLTLSAVNEAALDAATSNLAAFLKNTPQVPLADVAYTHTVGRKAFAHRRTVVANSREQAITALESGRAHTSRRATSEPSVAFLFPGQGSQYPQMGRELYDHEPVFRETVDQCAEILKPHLGLDLRAALYGDGDAAAMKQALQQTSLAQPALFVIEYATAKLWMSWGVRPTAMIGHSLGEYVAASLAGVFTLEDALALVAARGRLMQQMPAGSMIAVPLSAGETERLMNGAGTSQRLSLAAVNAPALSVVAGSHEKVAEFENSLASKGVEYQRLHTSHAFHSAMMDPILDPFRQRLRALRINAPSIPFVSNGTGTWIREEEATDPEYWVRHLRNPVRFSEGVATLLARTNQVTLEVGPGHTLTTFVMQQPSRPLAALTSLRRPNETASDLAFAFGTCGRLWSEGVTVNWTGFWKHETRQRIAVPAYPFQRKSFWVEADAAEGVRSQESEVRSQKTEVGGLRKKADIADWFYQPEWKQASAKAAGESKKSWLVFADPAGLADAVMHKLAAAPVRREDARLSLGEAGDIESLQWMPDAPKSVAAGEVGISVRATALNFADVLKATGAFPDAPFGMECAGVITAMGADVVGFDVGDEVVAIGPESHATRVIRDARFVARKPASLSFEQAVTLPAAYMTAWYALHHIGKLQRGQRILIHAAAGGVGLAAVEIALRMGLEIHATVGNPEKREYLRSLGVQHVFDSRTLEFAHEVLDATNLEGVDAVLNSLTGDFIRQSLGVVRAGGRFLEIGKREILTKEQLAALPLKPRVEYLPIDLTRTLRDDPDTYGTLLREVIEKVEQGEWGVLPFSVYPMRETAAAFQFMLQTRHIGKVVLSLAQEPRECFYVRAGEKFERRDEHNFVINPARDSDYLSLLESLGDAAGRIDGIAHLWNVTPERSRQESLEKHLERGFFSLTSLAKAMARQEISQPIDCLVVSNRMHDVAGETEIEPGKATLTGPCRVIPRELENIRCRSIDVSADFDRSTNQLVAEFDAAHDFQTIAYRGANRWAQTWAATPLTAAKITDGLREQGVYLITGAFGGIGLELAEHLAKTVHARLVLVGRTPPTADKVKRIESWQAAGAEVMIAPADVNNAKQLRAVVRQARARFGTIHGAFHAAGTLEDGLIQLKERAAAQRVLDPKVKGTLALDAALEGTPLDFLVLFSSVSSVLGLQGQVDYTAANAFLDAFAAQRSKRGARTIAINWGAWKQVGLAVAAIGMRHPWLDHSRQGAGGEKIFSTNMSRARQWLLAEHAVKGGASILPGTGYLELARAAANASEIRDVIFQTPFLVGPEESKELMITIASDGAFTIQSEGGRTTHVTGKASTIAESAPQVIDVAAIRERCSVSEEKFDGFLRQSFMEFGSRWGNVRSIRYGHGEALVSLALPKAFAADTEQFSLHPALLDMATGSAQPLIPGFDQTKDFYVPFSYGALRLYQALPPVLVSHIRLKESNAGLATFDVTLLSEDGCTLATITDFVMRRVTEQLGAHTASASVRASASASDAAAEALREGMQTAEGFDALQRILAGPCEGQVMAVPVDLDTWMRQLDARVRKPRSKRDRGSAGSSKSDTLERRIAEIWEQILGVASVGPQDDFFALGGHSLLLVRMATRIEKEFGHPIPLSFLFQSATIERIAEYLRKELGEGEQAPAAARKLQFFVPFNDKGSGPAYFCVHSMGGDATYRNLAKHLDPEQNFYGIQIPPELRNAEFTSSVEGMAGRYVEELLAFQPEGPYLLGGRSGGAPVAMEMAHQLRARGREVALLVSIDGIPYNSGAETSRGNPLYMWKVLRNFPHWLVDDALPGFSWSKFGTRVTNKAARFLRARADALRGRRDESKEKVSQYLHGAEFSERSIAVMESFYASVLRYVPRPYDGRVLLFQASTEPLFALHEVDLAWKKLASDLELVRVRGTHANVVDAEHVGPLAAHLNRRLREFRQSRPADTTS